MARKRKRKRRATPLKEHRRHKKTLTPPLLSLGGIRSVSYIREFLPDLLWVAAVFDQRSAWDAAYEPLDLIEEIAPPEEVERDGRKMLLLVDGRISAFDYVPEAVRADIRAALAEKTPWALPDELGHAFALYPECPAAWLFDDWRATNSADPEIGLRYFKRLASHYGDRETEQATHLRMVPIARLAKAGKLHIPKPMADEWVGYPSGLDEDGRQKVRASMRAMYNMLGGDEFAPARAREWAEYFWRQNWRLSPCEFSPEAYVPPDDEESVEEDLPEGSRGLEIERVHERWTGALKKLGSSLRDRQMQARLDLWEPTADEVRLGLAARAYRLLYEVIDDPNMWGTTGAAHIVRSIIDTRIVTAWLLSKNDSEMYERFRDYGLGKSKLYKLHLEDYIDQHADAELEVLRDVLEREVNAEILEEFQEIDLGGTFSAKSIRNMADEAGMKPVYTLNYQPLSAEAHGEWGSLRRYDLDVCTNPLHRFHRVGRFTRSAPNGSILLLHMAFGYARDTITDVYAHYDIDVGDAFEACVEEMNAAIGR
jgi:hypothetical protein